MCASDVGIGFVLQQVICPIDFFTRPLAQAYLRLLVYEKELISLAKVVCYWRSYLLGHLSHWLNKLMGFDFHVEYRRGRENVLVDALFWKHDNSTKLWPPFPCPQLDFFFFEDPQGGTLFWFIAPQPTKYQMVKFQ